MEKRGEAKDRFGRVWTAFVVPKEEAAEADFLFWYEQLTPAQRVAAVEDCLLSSLKVQGIDALPRFQRVSRVVRQRWD